MRTTQAFLLTCCVAGVLSCGSSRSSTTVTQVVTKYPPVFNNCPGDIRKSADPLSTSTIVSWTPPTAKSANNGGTVGVSKTLGPSPGSRLEAGPPVKVTYRADEGNGVPASFCSFYITVEAISCPQLALLQHGTRHCTGSRSNMYGSECNHTCDTGFKPSTNATNITCQKTGQWSSAAPICEPVSCGVPSPPANGQVVCYRGYTFSEMCSVTCSSGYVYNDSPIIKCLDTGSWTSLSSCVDKERPTFPNGCPSNQQLFTGPLETPVAVFWSDPDTSDNSGQTVALTSNPARGSLLGPGFHVIQITAIDLASNNATCTFIVEIKPRQCSAISAPLNSRVTCSRGYVEGSECMITCNRGFTVQGQALLTCQNSEQWSAALPTCDPLECTSPPPVVNGAFKCANGHIHMATCDLECDAGFQVQHPSYIQCTYNGTWTDPGNCSDTQPPEFPQGCPNNMEVYAASLGQPTVVTWSDPPVTDNSGQSVQLSSDILSGSNFSIGVTRVTYTATDVTGNSAICSFTATVNTAVCAQPDLQPSSGQRSTMLYDCLDGFVYGASCALNCTHGFPLVGPDTITCARDDSTFPPTTFWEWAGPSSVTPQCSESDCPDLKPPENGALSCLLGNFGWDCLMSCQNPYDVPAVLDRDGHFYCTQSVWSPSTVPDCTVTVRPGSARMLSDLFYYTDSCNTSLDTLKQNFITRITSSPILSSACVNVPTCTVDNVRVSCGANGRRKRRAVDSNDRNVDDRMKRAADQSHYVRIAFEIKIPYQQNSTQSFDEFSQGLESTKTAIYDTLQAYDSNGTFDIAGMTSDGFGQPTIQADCPAGTKSSITSALSCVGCSKGLYMGPGQQCLPCAVGSYTELDNATSCTQCPQGRSTLTSGSQSVDDCLELCPVGTSSPNGFVPCQPCPPGHHMSRVGATTCDLCPVNLWTDNAGANSSEQCAPADVTLSNSSVISSVTNNWSVLTVSLWVKLPDNNSSLHISITDTDNTAAPLASFDVSAAEAVVAGQAGGTQGTQTLRRRQWSRVMFILVVPNAPTTQYPAEVPRLTLTRTPSGVTTIKVYTPSTKKVVLSGLSAIGRAPTSGEVTASQTTCMGDNPAENLLTWSPRASVISFPSVCDAINDCLPNPCENSGVCDDLFEDFQCSCGNGYSGTTCQVPPDACYQNKCQNGATCVLGNGTYTCTCAPGFVGDRCSDQIVDGGWGEWGLWSQCSATCGGQQQRQRPCNNPEPQHGGLTCSGEAAHTRDCGELICIVNGTWSDWTTWSTCSATCGGGETTRHRSCQKPPGASQNEVAVCEGDVTTEVRVCNSSSVPCPVHGGWGEWSPWSPCSVTCADGTQSRDRSCDSPVPSFGGDPCSGSGTETRTCSLEECPACKPATLPRPTGGVWKCSVTQSPYLRNCSLICFDGYVVAEQPPPFTCGEETSYLWNHQRAHDSPEQAQLPSCTLPRPMQSATYRQYTTMNAGCDASTQSAVTDGIRQNLGSSVVCLVNGGCRLQLSSDCPATTRRKRSAPSLRMVMQFTLDLGSVSPNATGNDTAYQQLMTSIAQSLAQANDTQSLLTVNVGGQTITPDVTSINTTVTVVCPPGTVLVEPGDYCVACPAGTKAEDDQCVFCPLGQYQDQTGSSSCKDCPNDLTWDLVGASDVSQCRYPKDPSLFPPKQSPDSDSGDKDSPHLALIISLGCVGGLALLGFALALVFKWKQVQAARTQRVPRGSLASLNKVCPSPSTSNWAEPPPVYTFQEPTTPVPEKAGAPSFEMSAPPVSHQAVLLPAYSEGEGGS